MHPFFQLGNLQVLVVDPSEHLLVSLEYLDASQALIQPVALVLLPHLQQADGAFGCRDFLCVGLDAFEVAFSSGMSCCGRVLQDSHRFKQSAEGLTDTF